MIRKVRGVYVAECNECGEEYHAGPVDDLFTLVEELKADGWRITKDEDEYQHTCPDCQR